MVEEGESLEENLLNYVGIRWLIKHEWEFGRRVVTAIAHFNCTCLIKDGGRANSDFKYPWRDEAPSWFQQTIL